MYKAPVALLFLNAATFASVHLYNYNPSERIAVDQMGNDTCRATLIESIPEDVTFDSGSPIFPSIFNGWQTLVNNSRFKIDIAAFYWSLQGSDCGVSDVTTEEGEVSLAELVAAGRDRGVRIRIAQDLSQSSASNNDITQLINLAKAEVRSVNFSRLLGNGVLHTKLWIVDERHVYIGSANMDWRSLTQVKEVGVIVWDCPLLAQDVAKIFDAYWYLGQSNATIPIPWPSNYETLYNAQNPMFLPLKGMPPATVYLSSSPPPFCPKSRTTDIDAILNTINRSNKFVYIAVMDYFPRTLYSEKISFWPMIDNALRQAALERAVEVRLLASWWTHSRPDLANFLRSLSALNGADGARIYTKLFRIPFTREAQRKMPYVRVNHNKYMVTESVAYIGTSNWSADYFTNTGGVGLVINQTDLGSSLHKDLVSLFLRDWNSHYATYLNVSNFL